MKQYKFRPGHEDVQIPFAYVKGGVLNAENCTDEIVETINKKFPQYSHNFVSADYVESEVEGNEGEGLKEEAPVTNLSELKVPELKKLAAEKGLPFEANISKPELIELLSK